MSKNAQILLESLIEQEFQNNDNYSSISDYFEFFSASQILKNQGLSDDEVDNGIVGKGLDGGCDSIYLFLNNLHYCNGHGHSGWVKSPVSGKNIGKGQWLQIITNSKLKNRDQHRWIEVKGGFIESSYEAYTSDFQLVVEQHPQEMIELVLNNKERVLPAFVDSLFLGVEVSEKLEDLDSEVIERLLIERQFGSVREISRQLMER